MTAFAFTFAGQPLLALPTGALFWPDRRLLVVSDLHFGKSARLARRGGVLLPPYETRATLDRLAADIANTQPEQVICLGDSFDDLAAAEDITAEDHARLTGLMAGRDWIWVEGNHDPGTLTLTGRQLPQMQLGPLIFRHIAAEGGEAEISGHYHPKARLAGRTAPCFLLSNQQRLILPAYGAYTGGMDCADPALAALMGPGALAILTGRVARAIPYPYAGSRSSRPRSSSLPR